MRIHKTILIFSRSPLMKYYPPLILGVAMSLVGQTVPLPDGDFARPDLHLDLDQPSKIFSPAREDANRDKVSSALRRVAYVREKLRVFVELTDSPQQEVMRMILISRGNREREIEFRRRSAVERQDAKAIADTQNESDQYLLETRRQAAAEIKSRIRPQQKRVSDWLKAQGATIRHEFEILNLLSAEIPAALLPALEASPDVLAVDLVGEQNAQLDKSTAALNAPAVWRNGFTGAGESVLVLDSGIHYGHPAFGGRVTYANFFGNNPLCTPAELTSPALDVNGHGTHVAGIVASAGTSLEPNLRGVAYGLGKLYAAKISCGALGTSFRDDALQATLSALLNFPVSIVNNSNGSPTSDDSDLYAKQIDLLVDLAELIWVNAAGNDGPTSSSIRSPATAYNGITVANFDSTSTTLDVHRMSSRGPTLGGRKKPDIGAPGTNIRSTSNTGAGFQLMTGTSMAAPHIAGAAALLRQAGVRNHLAMKALLLNTTETFGWTPSGGWGFANLERSFQQRNQIALGSLNPNRDTVRLYQGTIPPNSSFYGTLAWSRHFNSGQSILRDFDMALYDQNSGQLIVDSTSSIDNVEQVAADNRNAGAASVVITLSAPENGSGVAEPFALAASQSLQALRGPDLRSSCQWPDAVAANATISISCTITNQGDLASLQSNGSLSSAGVTLVTASFGAIAPRQSSTQRFTIQTGTRSTMPLRLTMRGLGYGIVVEPFVDYTLAIATPPSCSFGLSATSALLQAPGGTTSVTVSTSGVCQWSASGFPSWLSASSAATFTGAGTLSLIVLPNPASIDRSVSLTVAGQSFLVRQTGTTGSREPVILAVTDAANSGSTISAGAWISIFGTNLASRVSSWTTTDFNGRQLPTSLEGVTVTVNGRLAYVAYVSPRQINALAPDDTQTGLASVIVGNLDGRSVSFSVNKQPASPALFTYNSNSIRYAAATHPDGTTVAPWGLFPGSSFRPVLRGDTVTLYATGCGPTSPITPSNESVLRPAPLAGTVRVELAGVTIPVSFAGVVSSGLCQLNVVVPNSVPRGNLQLVLRVDSYRSASTVVLPVD